MSAPGRGASVDAECPLLNESALPRDSGAVQDNANAVPSACPVVQQRSGQLSCPACGSLKTHRSRRRGVLDRMVVYIGGKIRRCDLCSTRFVRFGTSTVLASDLQQANQRVVATALKLVIFLVGISAGLGVIAFVWSRIL